MAFLYRISLLVAFTVAAFCQTGGVAPVWDTRKMLADLAVQAQRLMPILDKANPQDWMAKGAPEGYVGQARALKAEVGYLVRSANELAQDPEKLTKVLETFFRMEAVENVIPSYAEGIRRYQNPALAELLMGVLNETAAGRQKLRDYLVDLAQTREQEFAVIDREAQRCRTQITRPGHTARTTPKPEQK